MPIDDYTLAAFLSGDLSEGQRRSVAAHLITDHDARELLHMACEALSEAYATAEGTTFMRQRLDLEPSRPGSNRGDRPARYPKARVRGTA